MKDIPAFPAPNFLVAPEVDQKTIIQLGNSQGMTLRDYFAAKAMQGMLSRDAEGRWSPSRGSAGRVDGITRVAKFAYEYADAMLKARCNS